MWIFFPLTLLVLSGESGKDTSEQILEGLRLADQQIYEGKQKEEVIALASELLSQLPGSAKLREWIEGTDTELLKQWFEEKVDYASALELMKALNQVLLGESLDQLMALTDAVLSDGGRDCGKLQEWIEAMVLFQMEDLGQALDEEQGEALTFVCEIAADSEVLGSAFVRNYLFDLYKLYKIPKP
jgi:hypothetical protein